MSSSTAWRRLTAALSALLFFTAANAHEFKVGSIVIGHPWSRPTMSGMPMGVGYLTLINNGPTADALIRASSPVAASVEFHETRIEDGMARMRQLTEIAIAPGATVKVQPGGIHLMLVDLKEPLTLNARVPLELEFRVAGKVRVELLVENRTETAAVESEMTRSLGTVVVTARRASSLPTYIPTTIAGISGERVAETINASDAEDALKYFPSLLVRKRYIGDYDHAVLATRASGTGNSARSLVFVDGILVSNLLGNGASFTPRWGLVTPEEIARVDVLYGPFSAAYAGNSVGAVVDYVTRLPEKLEIRARTSAASEDFRVHDSRGRYSAWSASTSVGDRTGNVSWWLNFNRLDSDGHPLSFANKLVSTGTPGAGGVPVTGVIRERNPRNQDWLILGDSSQIHTVQDHAKVKLAWDISRDITASYTLGLWRNVAARDAMSYLEDGAGNPVYSGTINHEGRQYSLLAADFAPATGALRHRMQGLSVQARGLGAFEFALVASRYDYDTDRLRAPTTPLPAAAAGGAGRITDLAGTGWTQLAARGLWRSPADRHRVDFGVGVDSYRLRSEVSNAGDWRRDAPASRFSAFRGDTSLRSLYLQDSLELARDWQATLGLRVERWQAQDGAIANASQTLRFGTRRETFVSPKAAIAWAPQARWSLQASLGRAVRAPTVSELYQGSIAIDTIVNNDPDLAPEKSVTGELTAEREFDHGNLRITGFHEDTRDALYSQTNVTVTPNITNIQNVEHVRTSGLELAAVANGLLNTLDLTASLTWAHSRIVANPNFPASVAAWQPRVPEWRANALAVWRPTPAWALTLGARYSGRQYNTLDNSDPNGFAFTGTSQFLVADARARLRIGAHWTAALGVDNLTNETYWAFHPYAQRTYSAELAVSL